MMMLGCWRLEARERSEWGVVREVLEGQLHHRAPSLGRTLAPAEDERVEDDDDEDDDIDDTRL